MQTISVQIHFPDGKPLKFQPAIQDRVTTGINLFDSLKEIKTVVNWSPNETTDRRNYNLVIEINLLGITLGQKESELIAQSVFDSVTRSGLLPSNVGKKNLMVIVIPFPMAAAACL